MKKILTILSLLLTMPTYVFAANTGSSGGTTIGPVTGGGDEICYVRPDYTTVNFYGINSSGTFTKLKSVKYDHDNENWPCVSSGTTPCFGTVSKLGSLQFALNYDSSITYGGTTYAKGLKVYAAMYAGAGDDDLAAPGAPTNLIVTKTTKPVATTNPNITINGTLPNLNSKIQQSDNSFATQVNYILLYAANCLDTTGATSGAICSLNVNNGRAIYTNTCLNGRTSGVGAFGSTTVQAAATVSVASGTYQKPCS